MILTLSLTLAADHGVSHFGSFSEHLQRNLRLQMHTSETKANEQQMGIQPNYQSLTATSRSWTITSIFLPLADNLLQASRSLAFNVRSA